MPFIGEVRLFAGNFNPKGWLFCEGQLLAINQNQALFNLIGITYGGNGTTTFAIPDLRGRLPMHQGTGPGLATRPLGQRAGVESVTLTTQQIPIHNHMMLGSASNANTTGPSNAVPATIPIFGVRAYSNDAPQTNMHPGSLTPVGGSQPHENRQPYLALHFIISLFGTNPPQS
jgi:microcystin-dependent protein